MLLGKGTGDGTKTDEFSEKFREGGHFQSKIYISDFGSSDRALKRAFHKKDISVSFFENEEGGRGVGGVKAWLEFF